MRGPKNLQKVLSHGRLTSLSKFMPKLVEKTRSIVWLI